MAKSEQDIEKLLTELAEAKEQLEIEKTKRAAAEELAHSLAMFSSVEEKPTGETLSIKVCSNPTERDEKKQIWVDIDEPTYAYKIDLPKGFGWSLKTNGREFFHGQTYNFTARGLRDIKSRVHQAWQHEKMIHGDNENAYRRQREDFAG